MRRGTGGFQAKNAGYAPLRMPSRPGQRRALASPNRRDPRRFGIGMVRCADEEAIVEPAVRPSDNLRLFAHTFGAAFLFVTVFLA